MSISLNRQQRIEQGLTETPAYLNYIYNEVRKRYKVNKTQAQVLISYCGSPEEIIGAATRNQLARIPHIGIKTQTKIQNTINTLKK